MAESYKSGKATITVDQAAVMRLLERVSDGAPTRFIEKASAVEDSIKAGAMARWPVMTGKSRAGFDIRATARENKVDVQLLNPATNKGRQYAWFIRYARKTKEGRLKDARIRAAGKATPEARAKAYDRYRARIEGPNPPPMAPSQALAGKNPWVLYVRRPGQKAKRGLVAALQADLALMAKGR